MKAVLLRQLERAVRRREAAEDIRWKLRSEHGMTVDELWKFCLDVRKSML